MQGINTGYTGYPESTPRYFVFPQFLLIIVGYNKTTQYKEKTDPNKSFLKKMSIEEFIDDITMCSKNHYREYKPQ